MAEGGKTEITVWSWDSTLPRTVKDFEKANPDITVKVTNAGTNKTEYTALNNALSAGKGAPDLVQIEYYALPEYVGDNFQMLCGEYKFNRNLFLSANTFEGSSHIFDNFVDVKRCLIQKKILCVKFIERQQILSEIREPLCFKKDNF